MITSENSSGFTDCGRIFSYAKYLTVIAPHDILNKVFFLVTFKSFNGLIRCTLKHRSIYEIHLQYWVDSFLFINSVLLTILWTL